MNIGSNLLSSTVLGYLNTCTSNLQTQLNNKIANTRGTISTGNLTLTSGNLILGTYSLTQTILNSLITNYAPYITTNSSPTLVPLTLSTGNMTLTSGNLILGTYSLTPSILNSLLTNYGSYVTTSVMYSQGYITSVDVANFLNKNGDTMASTLNFSTSFALGSAYNRARICLYNVDSNLNYYGLSVILIN